MRPTLSPKGARGVSLLLMRSTRGRFVTMTYLVLETQWGELCYATGGHLPTLRRSGATHDGEDILEEIGRISPAPPEDDLTVLAVTWTPQGTGVRQ